VSENFDIVHPYEADLSFLYGTIFIDDSDRSSIHMAKKQVKLNQSITVESILGSQFQVQSVVKLLFL